MRVLLTVVAFGVCAGAVGAEDWPQWLGPQRDGTWREDGLVEKFPARGPKVAWKTDIGVGYAGPAVANGKVFVIDLVPAEKAKVPSDGFAKGARVPGKERVQCLDAATGKPVWSTDYPVDYTISYAAGPRCTPTVDGDMVYTLGAMGDLKAVTVADGKVVWSKNFMKDYDAGLPVWGFSSHPLVDGDKLICLVGGTNDRLVVAFDKKTGKELWTSQNCQGDFGYSPPMIYEFGGKRQLIVWHTRAVVGLEPDTGKLLWRVPFEVKYALTAPTPRKVGADKLFVTSFYNGSLLLKVGADKASVVWKSKARGETPDLTTDLSSIMATPVVVGEHIYGVCSYGQLRCIETDTGKRVWESMKATRGARTPKAIAENDEPSDKERWGLAFLIPQGDRYFLFNEQGDLIIAKLTPKGYEELDRAHLIDPTNTMAGRGRLVVWMHPAFANKCVFVRNDKELICYSLAKE
ncbi:PQQ-binding-like beta-propeller repeat protein [Gemmata sp. JC717]|uniref:PQQ-binding-like beta-propeller repeat protein n=1 Tax=Gemmata algarum TaxID=2975278 RepID=UPI0021BA4C34|nr:PQQ-binding-like beta-propeller repeat protein [Gemmata algarum]MDY3556637.1 PQQ-binding-like beta-propeller repeat protein [Gemmata algarum]